MLTGRSVRTSGERVQVEGNGLGGGGNGRGVKCLLGVVAPPQRRVREDVKLLKGEDSERIKKKRKEEKMQPLLMANPVLQKR